MTGYDSKRAAAADKNDWRCSHGWLRGEQCEICNASTPTQEPVAWMWKDMRGQDVVSLFEPRLNSIPLYTTPPKRPWVELTDDEEIADFLGEEFHTMTEREERFFRLGMQASKEKNT